MAGVLYYAAIVHIRGASQTLESHRLQTDGRCSTTCMTSMRRSRNPASQ